MSISTYEELKTAVANWLNRGDLTSRIPEFITLAEGVLNRKLRALRSETEWTSSYTSASRYVAYPSDLLEIIDLKAKKASADDSTYEPLLYVPPERMHRYYQSGNGTPQYYTVRNQIEIDVLPAVEYTLRLHGLEKWDIASTSTNWVLTNFPDAYLYGALVAAEGYIGRDERIPMWKQLNKEALREIDDLDTRNRDDGELSVSDLVGMSGGDYNIIRDR